MAELLQFVISGITVGSVYAVVALGFTIIYNASNVVNFARGEFVILGGMMTFFTYAAGAPLPLAALVAIVVTAAIGANGAGKATLLRCLSGLKPVTAGKIRFRGEEISDVPAHKRPIFGLTQSPEGRQIFTNLTVEENLRLGAYLYGDERVDADIADDVVRTAYLGI